MTKKLLFHKKVIRLLLIWYNTFLEKNFLFDRLLPTLQIIAKYKPSENLKNTTLIFVQFLGPVISETLLVRIIVIYQAIQLSNWLFLHLQKMCYFVSGKQQDKWWTHGWYPTQRPPLPAPNWLLQPTVYLVDHLEVVRVPRRQFAKYPPTSSKEAAYSNRWSARYVSKFSVVFLLTDRR